jgi:hypothetical protein
MPNYFDKPSHWRMRADMARTVAAGMQDAEAQRILYNVAADYDKMAARLELEARDQAARSAAAPAAADMSGRLLELQRKYSR